MSNDLNQIVYVLTNPAMPGLIKIGMTTQMEVEARMKQLYSTGVAFNKPQIVGPDVFIRGAEALLELQNIFDF
ncbi:MAG: hypothetical protein RL018_291 [Pseudomonadota bacterium]|jgi:hypothetical protein